MADGGERAATPDEVFGLLGNETRMAILQAIWDADIADHPEDNVVAFSELRDRVGVADSGRFNYHLGQLTGRFIRKTDAGYALRQAGLSVIRALLAGTIIDEPSLDPTPIETPCPHCGATVEVSYENEQLFIRCQEGTHSGPSQRPGTIFNVHVPPAGLRNRSADELTAAALRWFDALTSPLFDDVCPRCASRTTLRVDACEEHDPIDGLCEACDGRWAVFTTYECRHCRFRSTVPAYYHLWSDPGVVGWFQDRGIEFTGPTWESMAYPIGGRDEVVSTDPLVVEITVPVDDGVVTVTLDERMDVTALTT